MQIYKFLICLIAFELNSAIIDCVSDDRLSDNFIDLFEQADEQEIIDLIEADNKLLSLKTDIRDSSCLHLAAFNNRAFVVKYLLKKNIDINGADLFMNTALIIAAKEGFEEIVELLLSLTKIDINSKDKFGNTAIMLAVKNNHIEVVRLLLRCSGILLNEINGSQDTLLLLAIRNDNIEMLKLLLSNINININLTDNSGYTALHRAVGYKLEHKIEIIKILLGYPDIKVNTKDIYGDTILISAAYVGNVEVIQLLLNWCKDSINEKNNIGGMALSYAAANNRIDAVKLLVKQPNIDINLKDNQGRTAAELAKNNGHELISKFINGEIDEKELIIDDSKSKTIYLTSIILDQYSEDFMNFFINGEEEIIISCLEKFPKLLTLKNREFDGLNVFELALVYDLSDLVKYLISKQNIDINSRINGCLPLTIAASNYSINAMSFLINQPDIQINAKDRYGNTALIVSAVNGFTESINLLLSISGISVNEIDNLGNTALIRAAQSQDEEIVKLLLSHPDIKVDIKNKFGYNALDKALFYQYQNIVEIINAHQKN